MTLRWNWGLGIALVYTVFAGGTIGFVAFAMSRPADLVSPDYYERALEHDARRRAVERTAALGDAFAIRADADGRTVTIQWPPFEPDTRLEGEATLYRPSDSRADRRAPLQPDAKGRQHISLDGLPAGLWRVQVHWRAGGVEYYAEREVVAR